MRDKRQDDGDVERKLEAFFQAETDDLGPTEDLWTKVSGRLGKQENPRWYLRRPSFRSYATRRVLAAVILLLGMLTVIFFLFQMAAQNDSEKMLPGDGGAFRIQQPPAHIALEQW